MRRRIEMLELLAQGERTVESLAAEMELSVANTSQHLQALKQAALVESRKDGLYAHYRLADPEVFELSKVMRSVAERRLSDFERLVREHFADRIGRKPLIVWGMVVQAIGHAVIGFGLAAAPLLAGLLGSVLLGVGTAMVYPALLAAVGDVAHPAWRATAVGVYRFWRDLGYAVGALMAGLVAAIFGLVWAVHAAGLLTFLSGVVAWVFMRETVQGARQS